MAQAVTTENTISTPVSTCAMDQQLAEAEQLTNDLKRILVRSETVLNQEGIREQMEVLERWMESYRRGLKAAHKLSENGASLLGEIREKLKFAAEELQRLEGEGGNVQTKEQAARTEELIKAARHIDKVIPEVEHMFHAEEKTPA